MCKYTKFCNKKTYFCLNTKLHRKENVRTFWLHSVIFFTKFDLYSTAFQRLFSQIMRILEQFFRSVGSCFSCTLLCLQWKTVPLLRRNKFFLTIVPSLVGKTGFSLTHCNKEISNRNLVLM